MEILELSEDDVVTATRAHLQLPSAADTKLDELYLYALLRRAAGFLCPCSAATLVSSIRDSLEFLVSDPDALSTDLDQLVDALTVAGDLLELDQVAIDDPSAKGTWLFAAPPSFIDLHGSQRVYLIGLTADDANPLPESMKQRIRFEGPLRYIERSAEENIARELHENGWLSLSEQSWLKMPKPETAPDLLNRMEALLAQQARSGDVVDLQVLDYSREPSYYTGRWVKPEKLTGHFVARRPQAYGAALWGLAQLQSGQLERFLDFPLRTSASKWRGCDMAWHLQAAIDHSRQRPQQYRKRHDSGSTILDFFSPLPSWAERRIRIAGRPATRSKSLFSYLVRDAELPSIEAFLQERLWLARQGD